MTLYIIDIDRNYFIIDIIRIFHSLTLTNVIFQLNFVKVSSMKLFCDVHQSYFVS